MLPGPLTFVYSPHVTNAQLIRFSLTVIGFDALVGYTVGRFGFVSLLATLPVCMLLGFELGRALRVWEQRH